MLQLTLFVILFLSIATWIVWSSVRSEQQERDLEKQTFREHQQELEKVVKPPYSMPKPASRGYEEWVINPGLKVRLILNGIRSEHADKIYRLLNNQNSFYVSKDRREELINLFGELGVRFPDLEKFMFELSQHIQNQINTLKSNFPGWDELSEALQNHKLKGWKTEIYESLAEAPCTNLDSVPTFSDEHREIAKGFIKQFGFENLRFYSSINRIGTPVQTDMNSAVRNAYEKLYQCGLAIKGHDIKLSDYMDTFSMKQLSDLATTNNGIFNEKNDAIQYILNDPVCLEELEKKINFSTLYQSLDVAEQYEELNVEALNNYRAFYELMTDLFLSTYQHGKMAEIFKNDYADSNKGAYFTVKRNNAICKNQCEKAKSFGAKNYQIDKLPILPAHFGCTCVYSEVVND